MIIKSMARKEPSFRQLIEYMQDIDKADQHYNIYQNIFSHNTQDIEQAFLENARFIKKRKNGNYMYHEILSITKTEKLEAKKQKSILKDIAHEYARHRASNNLVFGTLHDDHSHHLHYHLLISSNALGDERKTRLSKRQFDQLKRSMEERVLTLYPELEQKQIISKQAGEKLSKKGAEQKRRTGETPQRDRLKTKLQEIFKRCTTKEDFFDALNKANLEFYLRGKTLGVKDLATKRNHRLKTLGMLDSFTKLSDRIELNEASNAQYTASSINQAEEKTEEHNSTQTINTKQTEPSKQFSKDKEETIKTKPQEDTKPSQEAQTKSDIIETERARRKSQMETIRQQQAQDNKQDKHENKQ